MTHTAVLALEDGALFFGRGFGAMGIATGEVVFNTAMTGYQEILTDPSYAKQMVCLTYPHIGNTGINPEDTEAGKTDAIWATGLIVRDAPLATQGLTCDHSNFRAQLSLGDFLRGQNVVAICDVDTRRLTRHIRDKGAQNGCILTFEAGANPDKAAQEALAQARAFGGIKGADLAKDATDPQGYTWHEGQWRLTPDGKAHYKCLRDDEGYHVVAYDFGTKTNILRMLSERNCHLTLVPATTPAQEVIALAPDGVFLSNGPGDPAACTYAIDATQALLKSGIPVFGICLGHQILALASGAKTKKMPHGHHGANHPVQDLATGRVMITSQNHGFCVDEDTLPDTLRTTHRSLFDGTNQGIERTDVPAFSFQGHPEASPGPHDCAALFDHFIELIEACASQA